LLDFEISIAGNYYRVKTFNNWPTLVPTNQPYPYVASKEILNSNPKTHQSAALLQV
jgi:hypothetical protein